MKKPERFVFVTDTHGNHIDVHAAAVFFEFLRAFKPTVRVHGGDAYNLAALRRGASDQEKREPLNDDIDAGNDFMRRLRPTVYLRGNHCERAWDLLDADDGKLAEYAGSIIERITDAIGGAKMLPYDKRRGIYQYGDHRLLHGYNCGMYAARHAASVYGPCLMGHTHAISAQSVPSLEETIGRTVGCMCKTDQTYNRAHLTALSHRAGFAYGFKLSSGKVIVYQAQSHDGTWYLPTEFAAVRGVA